MEAETIDALQNLIDAAGVVIEADRALQAQIAADLGSPDPEAKTRAQAIYELANKADRVARRLHGRVKADLKIARSKSDQSEIDRLYEMTDISYFAEQTAGIVRTAASFAAGRASPPPPEPIEPIGIMMNRAYGRIKGPHPEHALDYGPAGPPPRDILAGIVSRKKRQEWRQDEPE